MPFDGSAHTSIHRALPFTCEDYFHLVDSTGRCLRRDKRGFIQADTPPILQRLGINEHDWIKQLQRFGSSFTHVAGRAEHMQAFAKKNDKHWFQGIGTARKLFVVAGSGVGGAGNAVKQA
jgi:hypothetical protein